MNVPLFAHRPERCPFGHSLAKGKLQRVGWKPCICGPAGEGCGMGHLLIVCGTCHEDRREPVFYEPPHDISHREPGPWRPA
jgi:hypothetical protein